MDYLDKILAFMGEHPFVTVLVAFALAQLRPFTLVHITSEHTSKTKLGKSEDKS